MFAVTKPGATVGVRKQDKAGTDLFTEDLKSQGRLDLNCAQCPIQQCGTGDARGLTGHKTQGDPLLPAGEKLPKIRVVPSTRYAQPEQSAVAYSSPS